MCYVHNQWYDISCATLYLPFMCLNGGYHILSMWLWLSPSKPDGNTMCVYVYSTILGVNSNCLPVHYLLIGLSNGRTLSSAWRRNRIFIHNVKCDCKIVFPVAQQPRMGQDLLIIETSWSHSDTPTIGRTPLDKWSARLRALYLTTHITRDITMQRAVSKPTIPVSERLQTHALDRAATGIGYRKVDTRYKTVYLSQLQI